MQSNNGLAPRKRVTLAQVADAAGVSKSSVAFVLNNRPSNVKISDRTRNRILDAAKQLGYRPNAAARSLATGRSHRILLVSFATLFGDQNFTQCLGGVEAFLASQGYAMQLCIVDGREKLDVCIDILHSGQVDGILCTGAPPRERLILMSEMQMIARDLGLPMMVFGNPYINDNEEPAAALDEESGGRIAVEHFIEHGHERIAFLGTRDEKWSIRREKGYRSALESAGFPVVEERIIKLERHNLNMAYSTVSRVAENLNFTALFAVSDNLALAAILALKNAGRKVPDDCAVIGFDDSDIWTGFTDPPLTSIHCPYREWGTAAAGSLINAINGNQYESVIIPVSLVIRESCGCHPQKGKDYTMNKCYM